MRRRAKGTLDFRPVRRRNSLWNYSFIDVAIPFVILANLIINVMPLWKYCVLATDNQSTLFGEIEIVDLDALG